MLTFIARRRDSESLSGEAADGTPPGNRHFAYYVDVHDVDALYAELKPKLDTLPKGDVYGPVNQHYGQRELLVLAPDGNLIAFGQSHPKQLVHSARALFREFVLIDPLTWTVSAFGGGLIPCYVRYLYHLAQESAAQGEG